jgi:hypothetical protein
MSFVLTAFGAKPVITNDKDIYIVALRANQRHILTWIEGLPPVAPTNRRDVPC